MRRQQNELISKLRDQEAELKRLQDMKSGNKKSFSNRLTEETQRVEKLTSKLKRMEVLAQTQKKEMLAAGHKRFEAAKSMLADLEPKVGLLEAQFAAQQIELAAVENTRALEVALLARVMHRWTKELRRSKQLSRLESLLQVGFHGATLRLRQCRAFCSDGLPD